MLIKLLCSLTGHRWKRKIIEELEYRSFTDMVTGHIVYWYRCRCGLEFMSD